MLKTGGINVFEIFLYINPIGERSLESEKVVLDLDQEIEQKMHVKFIPLLNLQIVKDFMRTHHMDQHDLALRNRIFNVMYQVILDYKSASFQGNKKSRKLLMLLQGRISEGEKYSSELVHEALAEAGLNQEEFDSDRQSKFSRETVESDQQMAGEMGITSTPSTVVINYAADQNEKALLIKDIMSPELLKDILSGHYTTPRSFVEAHEEQRANILGHLRIL